MLWDHRHRRIIKLDTMGTWDKEHGIRWRAKGYCWCCPERQKLTWTGCGPPPENIRRFKGSKRLKMEELLWGSLLEIKGGVTRKKLLDKFYMTSCRVFWASTYFHYWCEVFGGSGFRDKPCRWVSNPKLKTRVFSKTSCTRNPGLKQNKPGKEIIIIKICTNFLKNCFLNLSLKIFL